ncbi:MAG: prolyl oligopeptidase family serine peptidase [Clostridia bacterium]|nr:prolyl oligopeptidase family serine peptidase [Clostridia bacterium]
MEKIINYKNLRSFAYSNDMLISGEIRGIVLDFFGLGGMAMFGQDPGDALEYARENIMYVVPYYNPWSWMNRQSVGFTDEIIGVLCEQYGLDDTVRIVSSGGSMGGLASIVYCAYAKITPVACVSNCPVCDLVYHFDERPDLPRTIYSALGEYECTLEEALRSCSPLHLADRLPHIPYTVFHCERDTAVLIEKHAIPFVREMEKEHDITLVTVPLRGHCDLSADARVEYRRAIMRAFEP